MKRLFGVAVVSLVVLVMVGCSSYDDEAHKEQESYIQSLLERIKTREPTIDEVIDFLQKGVPPRQAKRIFNNLPEVFRSQDWSGNELYDACTAVLPGLIREMQREIVSHQNSRGDILIWAVRQQEPALDESLLAVAIEQPTQTPLIVKKYLAVRSNRTYVRAMAWQYLSQDFSEGLAEERYKVDKWPKVTEAILLTHRLPDKVYQDVLGNMRNLSYATDRVVNGLIDSSYTPQWVFDELVEMPIIDVRHNMAATSKSQGHLVVLADDKLRVAEALVYNPFSGDKVLQKVGKRLLQQYQRTGSYSYALRKIRDHENASKIDVRKEIITLFGKED